MSFSPQQIEQDRQREMLIRIFLDSFGSVLPGPDCDCIPDVSGFQRSRSEVDALVHNLYQSQYRPLLMPVWELPEPYVSGEWYVRNRAQVLAEEREEKIHFSQISRLRPKVLWVCGCGEWIQHSANPSNSQNRFSE